MIFFSKKPKYLTLSIQGAHYLTKNNPDGWQADVLRKLLLLPQSPPQEDSVLISLFNSRNQDYIEHRLAECVDSNLINISSVRTSLPEGPLDEVISNIIKAFSMNRKCLLSDSEGLCIANAGFGDLADELAALAVEISTLHQRRAVQTIRKLGITSEAWGVFGLAGKSELSFWPLTIAGETFMLTIEGEPMLDNPAIVALVWVLYSRYGETPRKARKRRVRKARRQRGAQG